jgi:hypothetical protein
MKVTLFKRAGLVSIHTTGRWELHLGVYPTHWVWGRQVEEYDCCLDYVGLGPAFLVAALPGVLPKVLLSRKAYQ